MKRLILILLTLFIINSLYAQNRKVRVGLFRHWYVGAFDEVTGKYSIPVDTATYDFESYDEDEAGFWAEQYDHYYTIFDSLKLVIKENSIIYNNELFENVFTVKADRKKHSYYMIARSKSDRILSIFLKLSDTSVWEIYVSDADKNGWGGIWRRSEL